MPLSTSRPQGPTYLANTTLPVIASRNPPSSSWRQGYSRYLTQTAGAAKDKRVDRADQHYLPIYSRNRARARHKTGRHWSDHCYDREPFMSLPTRSLSTRGLAGTSSHGASSSAGPSPALVARIEEKRAELDSLKQLRDLSADVATQMEALQQQLSTLNDGTEAIATVIGNWHNVLRAINMASTKLPKPKDESSTEEQQHDAGLSLPQTLVRIPTEHAPSLQAQAEQAEQAAGDSP